MKRIAAVAAALIALVALAQTIPSKPKFRDVGPSNPSSGAATLDSLSTGFIDAGTVYITGTLNQTGSTASIANQCITVSGGVTTFSCAPQTSTNQGISMGSNGVVNASAGFISMGVGSFGVPQIYFQGDNNTGFYWVGADQIGITTGGARSFNFNATSGTLEGTTSSGALSLIGAAATITGTSFNLTTAAAALQLGAKSVAINTTPTISSGFGSSPSVSAGTNTAAFRINVGTGGVATTGVIALPAATTGWNCTCSDITTTTATVDVCKQTGAGTTTTVPIGNFTSGGIAGAWVASDILLVNCLGY